MRILKTFGWITLAIGVSVGAKIAVDRLVNAAAEEWEG